MKILLLSLLESATGNRTTIERIAGHLASVGHEIILRDPNELTKEDELKEFCKRENVEAAIGVHALGSGRTMRHCGVPYAIVFGGTDINESSTDMARMLVMTDAVHKAHSLVAFDESFRKKASQLWPKDAAKLVLIPQAVDTHPSKYSLRATLGIDGTKTLLLLPAGLRDAKDPGYLIDAFLEHQDGTLVLAIIGAVRDRRFAQAFRERVKNLPDIHLLDPIPRDDLHAAMTEANVVLNTSKSENCCNSLLEAMHLGTPVVARHIPGNRAIIDPEETGLLFKDTDEAFDAIFRLRDQEGLAERLTAAAKKDMLELHDIGVERDAYVTLAENLVRGAD